MSPPINNNKDIRELLEENQQLLKLILHQTLKTRKYIFWGRTISLLYIVFLVAPIVVAIIYLPPLFEKVISPYQELLGSDGGQGIGGIFSGNQNSKGEVNQGLLEEALKILDK